MAITQSGSTGLLAAIGDAGPYDLTWPAGVAAGRIAILITTHKTTTTRVNRAGIGGGGANPWVEIGSFAGGLVGHADPGAIDDIGLTRVTAFYKILDGTETGAFTWNTVAASNSGAGVISIYNSSAGGWDTPYFATGQDPTHGSATSHTVTWDAWADNSGLQPGDWVVMGVGQDTDNAAALTITSLTQTSVTFGTVTHRSRAANTTGTDVSCLLFDAPVNSGGSASSLALVYSQTTARCGAAIAVRLREAPGATALTLTRTVVDDFNDNSISGSWSNWGGANVTESSSRLNLSTTLAANYWGIDRVATVNITDLAVGATVVSAGNQALASYSGYPIDLRFSANNEAYWIITLNEIKCVTNVAAVFTERGPYLSYQPTIHVHFAIWITGGRLQFLWSTNGTDWNVHVDIATPHAADATVTPFFMVGTDAAEGTTTTFQVDDYSTWVVGAAPSASGVGAVVSRQNVQATSNKGAVGVGRPTQRPVTTITTRKASVAGATSPVRSATTATAGPRATTGAGTATGRVSSTSTGVKGVARSQGTPQRPQTAATALKGGVGVGQVVQRPTTATAAVKAGVGVGVSPTRQATRATFGAPGPAGAASTTGRVVTTCAGRKGAAGAARSNPGRTTTTATCRKATTGAGRPQLRTPTTTTTGRKTHTGAGVSMIRATSHTTRGPRGSVGNAGRSIVRPAVVAVGRRSTLGVGVTTLRGLTVATGSFVLPYQPAYVAVESGSTVAPYREGSTSTPGDGGNSSPTNLEWVTRGQPVGDDAGSTATGIS